MVRGPEHLLELEEDKQLAALVKDWDFKVGKKFQSEVFNKFRTSVHHPSSSPNGSFFLLAVFRRYTFRLTEDSVSLALHACLGGTPAGFHVAFQKERHFRFSVCSNQVGFLVCSLKRIITNQFDVYFHLWRDGGDNWERERQRWNKEEEDSWTIISRRKANKKHSKSVSFKEQIIDDSPIKKSSPQELNQVIKIGSIFCKIPAKEETFSGKLAFGFHPSLKSTPHAYHSDQHNQVPVRNVFQQLKMDLGLNSQADQGKAVLNPLHKHSIFHREPPRPQYCYRCLGLGHFLRTCRNKLRCWSCFSYGHKAKDCIKRRANRQSQWRIKQALMNPLQSISVGGQSAIYQMAQDTKTEINQTTTSSVRSTTAPDNIKPKGFDITTSSLTLQFGPWPEKLVHRSLLDQLHSISNKKFWDKAFYLSLATEESTGETQLPKSILGSPDEHNNLALVLYRPTIPSAINSILLQNSYLERRAFTALVHGDNSRTQEFHIVLSSNQNHHIYAATSILDQKSRMPMLQWPTCTSLANELKGTSNRSGNIYEKLKANMVIKKMYSRKKRERSTKHINPRSVSPVGENGVKGARCRPSTPLIDNELRRSCRLQERYMGLKQSINTGTTPRKKRTIRPRSSLAESNTLSYANLCFPGPAKFPTLSELEEASIPYPEIPIDVIQSVALETCRLLPEEMSKELLMAPRK